MATFKSIEEKAKRYDEAIKRAKVYHEGHTLDVNPQSAMEYVFPELKESEDERMRRQTLKVLNYYKDEEKSEGRMPTEIEECIAWLEKQKDICGERAKNITANMLEDGIEGIQRELIEFLSNTVNASWVDIIQSADAYAERIRNIIKKQKEQKPVNKVEPKFKVGDFVKNANHHGEPIYEIVGMDNECYICEYRGNKSMGDKSVTHFTFDNPYLRLVEQNPAWSEEDEKILEDIKFNFEYNKEKMTDALVEQYNRFFDKIKSLQPQPKQEWSEEDERHINSLIIMLEADEELMLARDYYKTLKDWLKSLKERMKGE